MIDYLKIRNLIKHADAVIIGAGAGLSTSAGIDYGEKNFKEKFPELVEKYGFTDMYTSSFYSFSTEEERWSYWAKHIDYLYNRGVAEVYKNLYQLFKDKNYFVITTNVDGQFLKAGFDKNRVFEVQGTLSKIQCSVACHDKLYDDLDLVSKMRKEDFDCRIPTSLVPICPVCHEKMEVHLRKDAFFVEDDAWHQLNDNYEKFIDDYQNKKILLLELGVGFNTPSIIRFPFERMVQKFPDTTLVRVNNRHFDLLFDLKDKVYLIDEDCSDFIEKIMDR